MGRFGLAVLVHGPFLYRPFYCTDYMNAPSV